MNRRQRSELVAVRAEFILADQEAAAAHALYFEVQMRRRWAQRLLHASCARVVRATAILRGNKRKQQES
jgi:hypothetical protein